jgi:hypothetical protein
MPEMRHLLELMRALAEFGYSKEMAEELFGWGVDAIIERPIEEYETQVRICFANGLIIEARYFLDEGLKELDEDCEITLKLVTDITSHVRYNIFYGRYIHSRGYIRLDLGDIEDRLVRQILENFFVPRLKSIYKPIILEFKGFYSRDFFGVRADKRYGAIYYSPVRLGDEGLDANIEDVIKRLRTLDELLKNDELRRKLAELDIQMSLLPSVLRL